ncbi:MAG: hypothetical protein JNK82_32210 [Myxococcaceae bacterium]|nr:hypothetical protein [Myxococcaceae bacterium]
MFRRHRRLFIALVCLTVAGCKGRKGGESAAACGAPDGSVGSRASCAPTESSPPPTIEFWGLDQ